MGIAVIAGVLLVGLLGGFVYVRDYSRYRGFPPPTHSAAVPFGQVTTRTFYSPALRQQRKYILYQPPGYRAAAARGVRFPVLYLLHPPTIGAQGFVDIAAVAVRMDELIAAHRIQPFLVVMPDGRHDGIRHDSEWANGASGRHEDFVLDTVREVDSTLATVRSRWARVLGGPSMGGYAAANITLHHLRSFGLFESWSGYFKQAATATFAGASRALLRANSPADYLPALRHRLRRFPVRAVFYEGRRDRLESIPGMFRFVREFRAAGGHASVALYPGGHTWAVWRAQMPRMLVWASHAFRIGGRA